MTLQEQIDRMAKALRMPKPTNVDPSQVFERVQDLRAHHDRVTHENEQMRARLDAVDIQTKPHSVVSRGDMCPGREWQRYIVDRAPLALDFAIERAVARGCKSPAEKADAVALLAPLLLVRCEAARPWGPHGPVEPSLGTVSGHTAVFGGSSPVQESEPSLRSSRPPGRSRTTGASPKLVAQVKPGSRSRAWRGSPSMAITRSSWSPIAIERNARSE